MLEFVLPNDGSPKSPSPEPMEVLIGCRNHDVSTQFEDPFETLADQLAMSPSPIEQISKVINSNFVIISF